MKSFAILFIVLFATIGNAAAQGDTTFTRFAGETITAIEAKGALLVTARQGEQTGVTITVPDRLKERLAIDLRDGRLSISLEKANNLKRNEKCRVDITYSALEAIDLSGVCVLTIEGDNNVDRLSVKAAGVSNIEIPGTFTVNRAARVTLLGVSGMKGSLLCDTLDIDISGNSSIALSGEGETADIRVSGTSHADLQALVLTEATAKATGTSKISLHVLDSLRAEATGLSRITYSGSPESLNLKTSGMAKITE